ncbi:ATP-binding cassette domain-containing protein [Hoeflea prorocentri]|uniref:ATP-binding cassette domain-containing protein n=1 Tax=Hoeflea prorocentri TaxID=1922333 RepID=A0A9X3UEB9_9HYPH|nr:ATP-binding cassette domain-containing protein [Hoeflea prorocentri]MCY6379848.1 ATP-binding cassette domain-containing protein [Hoeflea prorocentri]MDA5397648.1 ATP-binding cassette domain-containing protein [Hoeflea prorocentri]
MKGGKQNYGEVIVRLKKATVEIPLRGYRSRGQKLEDPRIFVTPMGTLKLRALKEVSLEIRRGDRIGIVGSNGSGKTTLLRLLSGLIPLASGTLDLFCDTRVLLDVGAGLSSALSGRRNAEMQFGLLGIKTLSQNEFISNVHHFSELGDFFDMPVATYSPGMLSRLQFAINTVEPSDILLLDEWIGVADEGFYEKAEARLQSFVERNEAFVCASHNTELLNRITDKRISLELGKIAECVSSTDH